MVCLPGAWEETVAGLKNVLDSKLYVMTNTTMLEIKQPLYGGNIGISRAAWLKTVGLNALIYSGRGKTVGTGLSEQELFPLLDQAKAITKQICATPDLVYAYPVLQFRPGANGIGRQRLHCSPLQYVHRTGRQCHSLPIVLSKPGKTVWPIPGSRSGITRFHCNFVRVNRCPKNAMPVHLCKNAAVVAH